MRARSGILSVALLLVTPLLGILVRFSRSGLPWSFRKYGGSVLWAALVYWVLSTALSRVPPARVAVLAEAVAVGVEYLKQVHTPWLEAFRSTLAGVLLLGREFSYQDILAYTFSIACVAYVDGHWLRSRPGSLTGTRIRATRL